MNLHLLFAFLVLPFLVGIESTAQQGRVVRAHINSQRLEGSLFGDDTSRPYQIYLPPSYDLTTNRYPVIYALHGYGDNETTLVNVSAGVPSAIPQVLNSMISGRQIGEVIAVFVCATNRLYGSFYLSSEVIGDYESFIAGDLVGEIDSSYRTIAARESRGIVGFSMGAWGAAHLALKFPDIFSVLVAQGGFYNTQSAWFTGVAKQLAAARPLTLAQFELLTFPNNAAQALFCGLLPNAQRPPLFSDYLYEFVGGKLVTNSAVIERAAQRDVQNGDLQRYTNQPVRLTAIKLVHGTQDVVAPISEAISFTNALKAAGIASELERHSGGHIFRANLAMPFIVTNLAGAQKYIIQPQLTAARQTNQLTISFPTQVGVNYFLEWKQSLDHPLEWTTGSTLAGNGQASSFTASPAEPGMYFRVRAANE